MSIAIYGAGGFGREVLWAIRSFQAAPPPACFIDDNAAAGQVLHGIPVLTLEQARDRFPDAQAVVAVGPPAVRERLADRAAAAGFSFATVRASGAEMSDTVRVGPGSVVCTKSVLTVDIDLGEHAQINLGCTVGHDVVADAFLTLAPGVHISGCVTLGRRVYIGTGAVILPGTRENPVVIADDVTIGAGAVVTRSVTEPGVTVVGIPGKILARRD